MGKQWPSRQLSGRLEQLVMLLLKGGRCLPIGMPGTGEPWLPCDPEEPLKTNPEDQGPFPRQDSMGRGRQRQGPAACREGAEMTLGGQNLLEA